MMRSRAAFFLFAVLLSTPVFAHNDELAEEMVPPPLDLDVRGTSLLWAGSPNKQAVALTFDDGPIPGKTEALLGILKENQVPATFFVIGSKAADHPELLQQLIADGHELGNHTQNHRNLTKAGPKEVLAEVKLCQEAVQRAVGFRPTLFRAPYGAANMTTLSVLSHLGLTAVFWSIDTRDWAAKDPGPIRSAVLDHLQNGDVILFHEHSSNTLAALPGIIQEIHNRGFVCQTVSQLFDRQPAGPAVPATAVAFARQSIRLPVSKASEPAPSQPEITDRPVPDFVDMAPSGPEVAVAAKPIEESAVPGEGYAKPEPPVVPVILPATTAPPATVADAKPIEPVVPTPTPTVSQIGTAPPSPTPTPAATLEASSTATGRSAPSASPTSSLTQSPAATSTTLPSATFTPVPSPSPTATLTETPTAEPVLAEAGSDSPAGQPSAATKTLPLAKVTTHLTELSPVAVKPERVASPLQPHVTVEGPGALPPPPSQGKPIAPIPAIVSAPAPKAAVPETHLESPHEAGLSPANSQGPGLRSLPSPPASIAPEQADPSIPKRVRRLTPVNQFKDKMAGPGGATPADGKGVRRSRILTPVQGNGRPRDSSGWGYSEQPGT